MRVRPTRRGLALFAVPLASCGVLFAAWGWAISSLGYERFAPGYALVALVLTSGALLGVRAALLAVVRRRPPLA